MGIQIGIFTLKNNLALPTTLYPMLPPYNPAIPLLSLYETFVPRICRKKFMVVVTFRNSKNLVKQRQCL